MEGGIEADVERVEHGACHRHRKNALSFIAGIFGSIAATVSPYPMFWVARKEAKRRQRT